VLAKELISDEIPPLKPTDTAKKAVSWMEEFRVFHLPVVHKNVFMGLISEAELLDMNTPDEPVKQLHENFNHSFVIDDQHVFDVVKTIAINKLSVIPVLDKDNRYCGCITSRKILDAISNLSFVHDPGGIIVLEVNINDYTLSQIAGIVESNDAKILGTYITSHTDSTKMEVTVKINRTDLSAIIQTFERFQYTVTASYDQGTHKEDLQNRFDHLMNYLNM
jgi:acetoin utilization protein AcuB